MPKKKIDKPTIVDGTKPGYEKDIKTKPIEFLKESADSQAVASSAIAAIPDPSNLNGAVLIAETPIMVRGGVRVKFRKVPAMFFNLARTKFSQILARSEPEPQEFMTDEDGGRILADTNPAFLAAKSIWENEKKDLDELVSSSVSLFSGLILVDDMPPDEAWLPLLEAMFQASGLDLQESFKSYIFDKNKMKELLFKQYFILSNAPDMAEFTAFQSTGDLVPFVASEDTASEMF